MVKEEFFGAGLSGEIVDSLTNIQIGSIIAEEGGKIIREKTKGTMLEMFLSEEMISSLLATIGNEIQIYIQEKGEAYIRPELDRKLNGVEQMSLLEILEKADMNQNQVQNVVENVYEKALNSGIDKIFEKIDISGDSIPGFGGSDSIYQFLFCGNRTII